MGLDYSFNFFTRADKALDLIQALSKRISRDFEFPEIYEPEHEDLITNSWNELAVVKLGFKLNKSKEYT